MRAHANILTARDTHCVAALLRSHFQHIIYIKCPRQHQLLFHCQSFSLTHSLISFLVIIILCLDSGNDNTIRRYLFKKQMKILLRQFFAQFYWSKHSKVQLMMMIIIIILITMITKMLIENWPNQIWICIFHFYQNVYQVNNGVNC